MLINLSYFKLSLFIIDGTSGGKAGVFHVSKYNTNNDNSNNRGK